MKYVWFLLHAPKIRVGREYYIIYVKTFETQKMASKLENVAIFSLSLKDGNECSNIRIFVFLTNI